MIDMSKGIEPKSDQLNADDLVSGPRTIEVTGVKETGNKEQPHSISFVGDGGRPYKPCKTMRRLLVKMWGKDGANYTGRRMTLFCDPTVTWAGEEVGGIRISHLSHIEKDQTVPLTISKTKRKPYNIRKLPNEAPKAERRAATQKKDGDIEQARTMLEGADADTVEPLLAGLRECSWTKDEKEEIKQLAVAAKKRKHESAPSDDPDDF